MAIGQPTPSPEMPPLSADTGIPPPKVRHALILCGHPGDAEHATLFTETITQLREGLTKTLDIPKERQQIVFGADRPRDLDGVTGPATKEAVAAAIEDVRKKVGPEDGLWVICLGHCHHDGRQTWWNLPGPDITPAEFGELFTGLKCQEQVFVMTTSLAGYFVAPLSQPGRVIIAATEAAAETNETTFPHVFSRLLSAELTLADHDVDKDGKLTLLDLYLVVARDIAQNYASAENLATEHQQIDDDGDRVGHELQGPYLPEELGGSLGKDTKRRYRDGRLAARMLLRVAEQETPR